MTARERPSVFFFLPSLRGGGAERVAVRLLEYLDRDRFVPVLVPVEYSGELVGTVPGDVEVIPLERSRVRDSVVPLARLLKRRQPDVLLSFMTHANAAAALAKLTSASPARLVVTEHATLSFRSRGISRWEAWLLRLLYGQADAVVAVSKGVATDLRERLRLPSERIEVIYNPVVTPSTADLAGAPVQHRWFGPDADIPVIIGCGRLVPQKGFDILLEAVALLNETIPVRLVILGKGAEHESLARMARSLGIDDCVAFLGFQTNPFRFMSRADVFVLSSLWEGLGIAIIEAMACGAPIVSTDCPAGPAEIVTHGVNGLLVPPGDPVLLAETVLGVLSDKVLAERLARQGQARAQDFHVDRIVRQYEKLFARLV